MSSASNPIIEVGAKAQHGVKKRNRVWPMSALPRWSSGRPSGNRRRPSGQVALRSLNLASGRAAWRAATAGMRTACIQTCDAVTRKRVLIVAGQNSCDR